MNTIRLCKSCGAPLPADAPEGLCPKCLLQHGMRTSQADSGSADAPTTPAKTIQVALPPDEQAGDRIGPYKLLQKIGEGGFGAVYMAEQTEPVRRRMALKIIKLGMDTKQVVARFEAERQALAMMDHPNIAKVLDAGTTNTGRPYFVMELVKGIRITEYCDQNNLSTQERLELFQQVCHAIQHAHQKGIIHRDVKPSNILVTLHDGVPVPKVIDFGVAKATQQPLTDKTVFTAYEQVIGTPAYMSPEQAEMSGLDIDTRSDVYSLGVLLYELLTGRLPFEVKELLQAGLDEMRRMIREQDPPRPSTRLSTLTAADLTNVAKHRHAEPPKLINLIRGDLDWIVMKSLEKDRTRRYETANGLADDVQRYLENEPVMARPPSRFYRLQKLARRNKLAFAAGAAVAGALIVGLGISTWMFVRERQAHQRAVAAEREQSRLRQEAVAGEQEQSRLRTEAEKARNAEAAQRQKVEENSKQLAESLSQQEQQKLNEVVTKEGAAKGLAYLGRALRRNPDNYRAAYRLLSLLSYQDVARLISQKKYEGDVCGTCYGTLGPLILTRTAGTNLWLWDYRREQPLAGPLTHAVSVQSATFTPSGRAFLVTLTNWTVEVWDTTNATTPRCQLQVDRAPNLLFSPDEAKVVNIGPGDLGDYRARVVQVWDLRAGLALTKPIRYEGTSGGISVALSRDGKQVVFQEFSGQQRTRCTLDIASGTLGPKQTLSNVSYGVDEDLALVSSLLLGTGPQGTISIPPARNAVGAIREVLLPPTGVMERRDYTEQPLVTALSENVSPDGQALLTPHTGGTISLWDVGPHKIIPSRVVLSPESTPVYYSTPRQPYLELSADGRRLLTVDVEATAKVWDSATGKLLAGPLDPRAVLLARLSPDGQKVVVARTNGWMRLWDAASGQALTPPFRDSLGASASKEKVNLNQLAFSRDGRRLAVGWRNGAVQVWDANSAKLLVEFPAHRGDVARLVFSPVTNQLATVGVDRTARVWDAATGAPLTPVLRHGDNITSCQFSPDGGQLATGSVDKTARLWGLPSGQAMGPPLKHEGAIQAVFFPAEPGLLVTLLDDRSVRVWDTKNGVAIQTIKVENQPNYVTLAHHGRFLLSLASYDGLRLWDVTTATPLTEPIRLQTSSYYDSRQPATLSADDQTLALLSGNDVLVCELPHLSGPVPDWLPRLAEVLAAQRLSEQGLTERVDTAEFLTLRRTILGGGADDAYSRWARWFFAERTVLTTAPFSNATLEEHVGNCVQANSAASLQEALMLDPGNVKALAAYLKLTGGGVSAASDPPTYMNQDPESYQRQIRIAAREALALAARLLEAIPDSSVAWHVKATAFCRLGQNEEALAALGRVNPAELGAGYWTTKARILEKLARPQEAYEALSRGLEQSKASSPQAAGFLYQQRAGLLQRQNRLAEAAQDLCVAKGLPARDPKTPANLIDLSLAYTGSLTNLSELQLNRALMELPHGVQNLGDTQWDIRGVICRSQSYSYGPRTPVASIPVNQRCRALHFLQSAAQAIQGVVGTRVGTYTVHYADQQAQEIPVLFGKHLWDWFYYDFQGVEASEAAAVWAGLNEYTGVQTFVRLNRMTWVNPRPEVEIKSLGVEFGGSFVLPFLVALTAETEGTRDSAARLQKEAIVRQSLETLNQAIARHPGHAGLMQAKANLLERSGQTNAALDLISTMVTEAIANSGWTNAPIGWAVGTKASLLERLTRTNDALAFLSEVIAAADTKGPSASNVLTATLYARSTLLRRMNRPAEAQADWVRAKRIPARDPQAKANSIDLTPYYNAMLTEEWHRGSAEPNTLAALPRGLQKFAGVEFDVRGIIQLAGTVLVQWGRGFPEQVKDIKVARPARRLHFLHATGWGAADGTQVGGWVVHYAGGQTNLIPIIYGENVRGWWDRPGDPQGVTRGEIAWRGENEAVRNDGGSLQLIKSTWENPLPDVVIESLDYFSSMKAEAAPFLIAVTVE